MHSFSGNSNPAKRIPDISLSLLFIILARTPFHLLTDTFFKLPDYLGVALRRYLEHAAFKYDVHVAYTIYIICDHLGIRVSSTTGLKRAIYLQRLSSISA